MVLLLSHLVTIVHALQGLADRGQLVPEMEMGNVFVQNRDEPEVVGFA